PRPRTLTVGERLEVIGAEGAPLPGDLGAEVGRLVGEREGCLERRSLVGVGEQLNLDSESHLGRGAAGSGSLVYPVPYCIEHKFDIRARTTAPCFVQSAGEAWLRRGPGGRGAGREAQVPVGAWHRADSLLGLTTKAKTAPDPLVEDVAQPGTPPPPSVLDDSLACPRWSGMHAK